MEGRFADAVIVAAGVSRRMGGTDKLQLPLLGRPLLAWTVEALAAAATVARVIVVTAADRVERLASAAWLIDAADPLPLQVVAGGAQRMDSVRAGVEAARSEVVLVHDGARPLASPALADVVARRARRHGAAIPVIPVADSLRHVKGGLVAALVERDGLASAQTPQGARRDLLQAAFHHAPAELVFTDEAALLGAAGTPVATVAGEASNIKVTVRGDLEVAAAILASRNGAGEASTGYGEDSHPFGPLDGLWLGGILIDSAPRLHGHSDGDVALHALATALLSAARLGDLGRRFPPSDPATAGAASAGLLAAVVGDVRASGWRVSSAQLSLLGARPRLGAARLDEMRARIAEILGTMPEQVSVTASSGNLTGPEGAGLVIRASAFVTLVRR
ncbi:MAG TPA: 2-C-methyl-D-erythritol 2,4-cyclodiphosphate synthase [Candidatus Limnocylindrales bacterium]|nr:2-C-methyl-D-erythritol 2,4-cyclodiphosphate synthase [Candidatus Limnocylindrales bacterium]